MIVKTKIIRVCSILIIIIIVVAILLSQLSGLIIIHLVAKGISEQYGTLYLFSIPREGLTGEDIKYAITEQNEEYPFYKLKNIEEVLKYAEYLETNNLKIKGDNIYIGEKFQYEDFIKKFETIVIDNDNVMHSQIQFILLSN